MVCISNECPLYMECDKAVQKHWIEDCVPYASCATCKVSEKENETAWWCGPLGYYRLFEPKKGAEK